MVKKRPRGRRGDAVELLELALNSHAIDLLSRRDVCTLRATNQFFRQLVAERSSEIRFALPVNALTFGRSISALSNAFPSARHVCVDANDGATPPRAPMVIQEQLASILSRLAVFRELSSLTMSGVYELPSLVPLFEVYMRLRTLSVECLGWASVAPCTPLISAPRSACFALGALEELRVTYFGTDIGIGAAMRAAPNLRVLSVGITGVGDQDVESTDEAYGRLWLEVASSLPFVQNLRSLSLDGFLDDNSVSALAGALPAATALRYLSFVGRGTEGSLGFSPIGACALATALPSLKVLSTLELLGGAGIGDTGAEAFAAALPALPRLAVLGLSLMEEAESSFRIGAAGTEALAAALLRHTPRLEMLALDGHIYGEVGSAALAALLRHRPLLRSAELCDGDPGSSALIVEICSSLMPLGSGSLDCLESVALSSRGSQAVERISLLASCVAAGSLPALRFLSIRHDLFDESEKRIAALRRRFPRTLENLALWAKH